MLKETISHDWKKKYCLYAEFDPTPNLGIAELFVNVIEMVQVTLLISLTKIYLIFHAETRDKRRLWWISFLCVQTSEEFLRREPKVTAVASPNMCMSEVI